MIPRKDKSVTPLVPLGALQLLCSHFFAQYPQNRKTTKVVMKKEKKNHSRNSFQLKEANTIFGYQVAFAEVFRFIITNSSLNREIIPKL